MVREETIVYDPSKNKFERNKLPNKNELLEQIKDIYKFMIRKDVKSKKGTKEFNSIMKKQFPEFSERYMSLFDLIIEGKDITELFPMLDKLEELKNKNANINEADKEIIGNLSKKYIPKDLKDKMAKNKKLNPKFNKKRK